MKNVQQPNHEQGECDQPIVTSMQKKNHEQVEHDQSIVNSVLQSKQERREYDQPTVNGERLVNSFSHSKLKQLDMINPI